MVKKKNTKVTRKKSSTSNSSRVAKKQSKKRQHIVSLKPSRLQAKKLNNYREFLRYLFSNDDVDYELSDEG